MLPVTLSTVMVYFSKIFSIISNQLCSFHSPNRRLQTDEFLLLQNLSPLINFFRRQINSFCELADFPFFAFCQQIKNSIARRPDAFARRVGGQSINRIFLAMPSAEEARQPASNFSFRPVRETQEAGR